MHMKCYKFCASLEKRNFLNILLTGVSSKLLLKLNIAAPFNDPNTRRLNCILVPTMLSQTPLFINAQSFPFFFLRHVNSSESNFSAPSLSFSLLRVRLNCVQWTSSNARLAYSQTACTAAESCGLRSLLGRLYVSYCKEQNCSYVLHWAGLLFILIGILMLSVVTRQPSNELSG
jgi:hypothetical protein